MVIRGLMEIFKGRREKRMVAARRLWLIVKLQNRVRARLIDAKFIRTTSSIVHNGDQLRRMISTLAPK